MTKTLKADLCVIGAGSAGLSVAAGAAQLGRRVVLCEKGEMGGDCLNYGCVPSKALIAAANAAAAGRQSKKYGVTFSEPEIDFPAVIDHVHGVIAAIAPHDSQERFEGLGVTVIRAAAEFTGERQARAGDHVIDAKHFVIASGSAPAVPPIPGLQDGAYFTNESIFENRQLPEHLIVIGGGPIGVELGQAFRRLGSIVTIVEAEALLNRYDREAVAVVRDALTAESIRLIEGSAVESVMRDGARVGVNLAAETVWGTHLLVATGRRSNIDGLGLEKAGVESDGRNIIVDDRLRTTNKRIYAIGDAAGGAQFTHVAGDHASTLVRNILFKMPAKRRDDLAPHVTYCAPEIASVGASTDEATADSSHRIVRWPFADNDRAQTERDLAGFVKIATRKNGRIEGATIVGRGAGDHILSLAHAIANRSDIKSFTNLIAPYPTRGEALKRAAGAWYSPTLFSDRTRTLVRILSIFD